MVVEERRASNAYAVFFASGIVFLDAYEYMIRYTTKKTRVRFNLGIQRERPVSYGKFPEKKWGVCGI